MDCDKELELQVKEALKLLRGQKANTVRVASVANPADYKAVYGGDAKAFAMFQWQRRRFAAALEAQGIEVKLVNINPQKYFEWLGDQPNDDKRRGLFVTLERTAGELPPEARINELKAIMDELALTRVGVGIMLGVSFDTVKSYLCGRMIIPVARLERLRRIADFIKNQKKGA